MSSASARIVRNLNMRNSRPPSPARAWTKNADPPSTRFAAAMATKRGAVSTSRTPEIATSSIRLSKSVERETSQVLYSTTGRSATWWSCTAVREDSAHGRDDTELHMTLAAGRHQLGDEPLVDRCHRQHQPIGCEERRASVAEPAGVIGPVRADHGGVDVGEELELPAYRTHELVTTDDHHSLRGRETPPGEPCEAAEETAATMVAASARIAVAASKEEMGAS